MNIQFNSKDAKNFRLIMSKAYSAYGTLNDFMAMRSDRIKAINENIRISNEDLLRLEKGESVTRTKSELEDYIKAESALLDKEQSAYKVAREDCKKAKSDAFDIFPKSVYNAYVEYTKDMSIVEPYAKAISDALVKVGVKDATPENCAVFVGVVGKKLLKGKSAIKANSNTGAMTENMWRDLFVADLCETLVSSKAITPFKYSYVFPTK